MKSEPGSPDEDVVIIAEPPNRVDTLAIYDRGIAPTEVSDPPTGTDPLKNRVPIGHGRVSRDDDIVIGMPADGY